MNVKTKTFITTIAVSFIVGCVFSGCFFYHISNQRTTESDRQISGQYTDTESKINNTIQQLEESIGVEQRAYRELTERFTVEQENYNKLEKSIKQQRDEIISIVGTVESSIDDVQNIKQGTQKIREILEVLEKYNVDNYTNINNNSIGS